MNSLEKMDRLVFANPDVSSVYDKRDTRIDKNRHYVTLKEAAGFYSMTMYFLKRFAVEADALVYAFGGKNTYLDCDAFEAYLENCRLKAHNLI